jgi:hypothetical protein
MGWVIDEPGQPIILIAPTAALWASIRALASG